jgi:hypothetical protein
VIIYEAKPYRDGPDVYEFRDTRGETPICRLARTGDHWELLFYRGPSNPGPYRYSSFEHAKRHLDRYLDARGDKLVGPLNAWSQARPLYSEGPPSPRAGQPPAEPAIPVPRRRPRRRSW